MTATADLAVTTINAAVRRYVAEYPEFDSRQAAEAIVGGLSHAETRYAAIRWVAMLCEVEDRADARQIEKQAAKPPAGYEYDGDGRLAATRVLRLHENEQQREEWQRVVRVADGAESPRNAKDLAGCQERVAEWRERERLREQAVQRERERHQAFVDRIKAEARMEWTADLLASTFAVGDGTRVSWAEATVQQHEQRIAFLTRHVEGSLDTLKRHEVAVAEILAAHADTLAGAIADSVDVMCEAAA